MGLPEEFWSELSFLPGGEREALKRSYATDAPVAIRLNNKKWEVAPLEPVPWSDAGYYLPTRPSFTSDPLFHAGAYYVQEPSSMVIGTLFKKIRGTIDHAVKVLDLCAAPGGKSTDLASQLTPGDQLLSNEVINSRVHVLKENVIKWGAPNHHVCSNDPADFQRLPGTFDVLVVDAPCSGEGLFRKDSGAAAQWSPEAVTFCQRRQLRILEDAWDTLKEGGILIYSTCTLNEKENEGVLKKIVARYDVSAFDFMPSADWSFRTYEVNGFEVFKIFPHKVRGEGFSFFVLRKLEETTSPKMRRKKKQKSRPTTVPDLPGQLSGFGGPLHVEGDRVLAYEGNDFLSLIQQHLRMVKRGTLLGTLKKGKLVPSHELAMATAIDKSQWPRYPLSYDEAIRYLQRGSVDLPLQKKGFGLVYYRDLPLGWINHLGNRNNNMYPAEYRILTQSIAFEDPRII